MAKKHGPVGEAAKQVQPEIPLRRWKRKLYLHLFPAHMRKASDFCGIDAGRYLSYYAVSMSITGSLSVVIGDHHGIHHTFADPRVGAGFKFIQDERA
jgi:hypothetical protein